MSDALDYLLKTRPDAIGSYFSFLKQAGKHLDPKTRAIISVITKVDNQTETGFRQYLTRALREGVTADEILDALLLAFPTLGLTKIIWAIDILLAMDIPEFRPEQLAEGQRWHDIAATHELTHGKENCINYDGHVVFVFIDDEALRVFDSICPHQLTHIPAQAIENCTVICPKHKWKFDLKTGECIENGDKPLKVLEHKIENNRLLVYW